MMKAISHYCCVDCGKDRFNVNLEKHPIVTLICRGCGSISDINGAFK